MTIKKMHLFILSHCTFLLLKLLQLGLMQKIQLQAKHENVLCKASNNKTQCYRAKTLSLTVFPTLSLQFNLVCAVALRHTDKEITHSSKLRRTIWWKQHLSEVCPHGMA